MSCCNCTQNFPFFNVSTTSIPWSGQMPGVIVGYLNDDGVSYTQSGIFSEVVITPTSIEVDHGGVYSGIVKVIP